MAGERGRLTLGQFFVACAVGLALLLGGLLSVLTRGSRQTIVLAATRVMERASARVTDQIEEHLREAERVVTSFEARLTVGLVQVNAPADLERALVAELAPHPDVTEVSFTYARSTGPHDGELTLAPDGRGQVTVARQGAALSARRVSGAGGSFTAERRTLWGGEVQREAASDPTAADTFTGPLGAEARGKTLWSDLFSLPPDGDASGERRRVVTVQKALFQAGELAGVIRVVLLSGRLDSYVHQRVEAGGHPDPHRVFLCDRLGRLVSRLEPHDRFALVDEAGRPDRRGEDLRVIPAALPPEVAAALRVPGLGDLGPRESLSTRLDVRGGDGRTRPYLVTLSALPAARTYGWVVGIVVPEAHYLADLAAARRRLLLGTALVLLAIVLGGVLVVRALRGDLGRLIAETTRLRAFDFVAAGTVGRPPAPYAFRDVDAAAESLEQAKTALRALARYVPLDLVRQLYQARIEPRLGARLQEVTILFSDIEGFTTVSEWLPTEQMAVALGQYLEVMTQAIHGTGGIIDKYTGDGVMALWNTPNPLAEHSRHACEAALRCREATTALFASLAWGGLPAWHTRFGIHRAEVSVGHFGAPDRMSFTAMGDGVNLAARLEGLNKQYGTSILVSATVAHEVRDDYLLRRLDRVAVKGKREGVEVYELVGRSGPSAKSDVLAAYEAALSAYFARRFEPALELLADNAEDRPSQVLANRCHHFLATPPPPEWNGVYVATEK